jgi:hypothetical protein
MPTGCPITSSGNNALQEKQCKNNQNIAMLQAKIDANRKFDPDVKETKVNLVEAYCNYNNTPNNNIRTFGTIGILSILAIILYRAK